MAFTDDYRDNPAPPPPRGPGGWCRFQRSFLPAGILATTGVFMAAISWLKWPDILIDYGRELYVPWRISDGEMLYRDIPHLFGPFAQYFNALLFSLFGASLKTLVFFNLFLIGVLTFCIYGIFRRAFDRLTATLCGMVFLGAFAFARYTEAGSANFVCPYAHEVTYGIALFFLMVPALERYQDHRSRRWAAVAGLLLGLIFLAKVEVFVAALVSAVAGFALPALRARSLKMIDGGAVVAACAGFAAPLLFFIALFSTRNSVPAALGLVVTSFTSLGHAPLVTNQIFRMLSGLDAPLDNIALMIKVSAVYAALALGIFLVAGIADRVRDIRRRLVLLAVIVLPLGAAAYLIRDSTGWWLLVERPLPLIILAYVLRLAWRSLAEGARGISAREATPRAMVSIFGLLLLLKILLNVQLFGPYGFALALPATLVLVAIGTYHLPRTVAGRSGCGMTTKVMAAAVILLVLAVHMNESKAAYDSLTYPVGSGNDLFFTMDPAFSSLGPVFNETLAAIASRMPRNAGFVVIPEGVMLNYLTRRRNPGRWFEFNPAVVESMGEDRMRADLEAGRPEYIVLTERKTSEYGSRYFGVDYGLRLKTWVTDHYIPIHLAGSKVFSDQGYGIAIAQRKLPAR